MKFQSNYVQSGHEMEKQGMEERSDREAATPQRLASFNASTKPALMTAMDLCFPHNLTSSSTLDSSLMAVECWKMAMREQSTHDALPSESSSLSITDLKAPRGGSASQSVLSGLTNDQEQGPHLHATGQELAASYQDQGWQAPWQPGTSAANIFLPHSTSGDSYNHFTPFQNPISWHMTAGNMAPSEIFAAFVTPAQAMMVSIPSASNSYAGSRPQSQNSGIENHSPANFEASVFALPNSLPEEEYEHIPGNDLFARELRNIFVFGSSEPGTTNVYLNPSYEPATDRSLSQPQNSADDAQNEKSSVTWTKIETMPASSVYSQGGNSDLVTPHVKPESSAGTFSTIHLHNSPVLPEPQETIPRMDELIVNFETNPGARPSKGKRKAFGPAERKKVKKVRENGACFCCRAKKVAVSVALLSSCESFMGADSF